jgi:hypothetical protein
MSAVALSDEVVMTLLDDLRVAIRNVVSNSLPGVPMDVQVVRHPKRGILVTVETEPEDPRYPTIHVAKAVLRPSNLFRRLNGLPVREE